MAFRECFPLGAHSHIAQALSLVFWCFRLLSGGFAVHLEPVMPSSSVYPPEVAEVGFFSFTRVRHFTWGAFSRRFVAVLWSFLFLLLQLPSASMVSISDPGFRTRGFIRCSRIISILHGAVCAVLELLLSLLGRCCTWFLVVNSG